MSGKDEQAGGATENVGQEDVGGSDEQDWAEAVPPADGASLEEWVAAAREDAILSEWMLVIHVRHLISGLTADVLKAQFAAVEPEIAATWGRVFDAVFAGQVEFDSGDVMREIEFQQRKSPHQQDLIGSVQAFLDSQILSKEVSRCFSCTVVECLDVDDGSLMVRVTFTPKLGPGALSADELRDFDGLCDKYLPEFERDLAHVGMEVISRQRENVQFRIPARLIARD